MTLGKLLLLFRCLFCHLTVNIVTYLLMEMWKFNEIIPGNNSTNQPCSKHKITAGYLLQILFFFHRMKRIGWT
jgi:hypothetical protein